MTLREEYERLVNDPTITNQTRGLRFEEFIGVLCRHEQIRYRQPYRPIGEQIDGAIEVEGQSYLIEAKYENVRTSAAKIYAFRGKIEGKLSGTLGIFWSVTGYSEECLEAIRVGKELNVILFDDSDLKAILDEAITFTELLEEKRWIAITTGVLYYPWRTIESLRTQQQTSSYPFIILAETSQRLEIFEGLIKKILPNLPSEKRGSFFANGTTNIMNTLEVMASQIKDYTTKGVLVLLDWDNPIGYDVRTLRSEFYDVAESLGVKERFHITIADPDVPRWLNLSKGNDYLTQLGEFDWTKKIDSDPEIDTLVKFLQDKFESMK